MANSPPPHTPEMSLMKQDSVSDARRHPRFSRTLSSVLQECCLEKTLVAVLMSNFRTVRWVSGLYQLLGSGLLAEPHTQGFSVNKRPS